MSVDVFLEAVTKNDLNAVKNYFKPTYMHQFDKNGFTGFLHACNLGYVDIVKYFLQNGVDLNHASPNGWNGLHWAAGNGCDEVVLLLLQKEANKESETGKKYRPIHCAVVGNHVGSVRILLANGCDLDARNKDGKTSMELALDLENEECRALLKKWIEYDKIFDMVRRHLFNDFLEAFLKERVNVKEAISGMTILDVAVQSKSFECLENILLQDLDESVLLESLNFTLNHFNVSANDFKIQYHLYRSILLDFKDQFEDCALIDVINSPWILTGESFLETCVKFRRKDMVVYTLQALLEPSKNLNNAVEIANIKGFGNIKNIIIQRKDMMEARERARYGRLHIAIQDNRVDLVRFILNNNLMDENYKHQVVGPPLCFALLLGHVDCVQALLEHGVNVNVVNKYNQTPLHIAIESGTTQFNRTLIDRIDNVDKRDNSGFTALHHATIAKDDEMCRLLLNKGANIVNPLNIPPDNLYHGLTGAFFPLLNVENPVTISLKLHRTIIPALMERIDGHNVTTLLEDGGTFLHLSARLLLPYVSSQLIAKGAEVNIQNVEGNTPLHCLFLDSFTNSWQNEGFMETLHTLVINLADVNMLNYAMTSPYRCAFETGVKNILNTIMNNCDILDSTLEDFITVYNRQWPDVLETMLYLQKDEFKRQLILFGIEGGMDEFIDFVLEKATDCLKQSIAEDGLYNSAKVDNEKLFEKFMLPNLQNLKLFPGGETLLTLLILDRNEKYALKLAKSDLGDRYLDFPNEHKHTPLYLAAEMESLKLCKYLVLESHSLEYKDSNEETAMERLLRKSTDTDDNKKLKKIEGIIKTMIRVGMDINRVNKKKERAITFCKNVNLKKKLESFSQKNNEKRPKQMTEEDDEKNLCEICLSNVINCQFGCGHPFCRVCADKVPICPKCRKPKSHIFPLYLS